MIRYPGGKKKFLSHILKNLKVSSDIFSDDMEYREPFFGAGSVGCEVLKRHLTSKLWINDFDKGIYAIWNSVLNDPKGLVDRIKSVQPSVELFDSVKIKLLNHDYNDLTEMACDKIAIHQMSYSGLGLKSGGPLGGREQKSAYPIDCRWSPNHLEKNINKYHDLMRNKDIRITNLDFKEVIDAQGTSFIYLDPPYFVKGEELYQQGFSMNDHVRLCGYLKRTNNNWLLSYDDATEIKRLYEFAHIKEIPLTYTINGVNTKMELLISNNQILQ